jgi:hypothetical protein
MAENTSGSLWDQLVMQSELSPREKALRDEFIKQYLVDLDGWAAAIRVGFLRSVAAQYATMLLEEPYVRREITRLQMEEQADPTTKDAFDRRMVRASLMREAHAKGPGSSHAARVQALAKLCNILEMDGAVKVKSEVTHKGGVMVVPGIASVEDWEKAATASQEQLVQNARH